MRHLRCAVLGSVIRLVHGFDAAQPLDMNPSTPARHDHADRVAVLEAYRFTVLSVSYDDIVHSLFHGKGAGMPRSVIRCRKNPSGILSDTRFLKQQGKQNAGPLGATGTAGYGLNGLSSRNGLEIAVSVAFEELNSRDGRQTLQLVQGEDDWPVHHAVDQ